MKRIPELDGVRGIAILAVLGCHTGIMRGGFHGVDIFFTLSGFLITGILINEHQKTGRIGLGRFYYRRALRLLPALFAYVAFCAAWATIRPVFSIPTWQPITATLFYFVNWFHIASPDDANRLGPFNHLWSLSIEEQFYMTWPLLLIAALWLKLSKRTIAFFALSFAVLALIERFWFRHSGASFARIYDGTDTRADGLLIGCACALLKDQLSNFAQRIRAVTIPACWLVAYLLFAIPLENSYLTWASVFAVSAATGLVISSVAYAPIAGLQSILASKTLVYFGQRSYSLYLWHRVFTRYVAPTWERLPGPVSMLFAVGLSIAAAEASYRLIELPFLKFKDRNADQPSTDKSGAILSALAKNDSKPSSSALRVSS